MAGELNLHCNLSARKANNALVESFYSSSPIAGTDLEIFRDDVRNCRLHFQEENENSSLARPYRYIDPSAWASVKLAIGTADLVPTSGSFTITDVAAGQTTAAILYNAGAADVQSAIRSSLTTNFSSAIVSDVSECVWTINRVATGAYTTALTITATALSPSGSTGYVINTEDGTASLSEKWLIGLSQAHPILKTTGWTAFPSASVSVTEVQAGSATANKIFRVQFNSDAYDGAVSLEFEGDTTTSTVTFPYNADTEQVVEAFELHPDVEDDGVKVIQNGKGDYTIECVGVGILLSDTPELATASDTLQVPVGLSGTLPINTALATSLLGDDDTVDLTLEIEIQKTSGVTETIARLSGVTLTRDLIRNSPGSSTGTEIWLSTAAGTLQNNAYFIYSGTGAASQRTAIGAAAIGANTDITSLNGLLAIGSNTLTPTASKYPLLIATPTPSVDQSMSGSYTNNTVVFSNVMADTASAFSSNAFTVPTDAAGDYEISLSGFRAYGTSGSDQLQLWIFVNGTYAALMENIFSPGIQYYNLGGSTILPLAAGDVVTVRLNTGASSDWSLVSQGTHSNRWVMKRAITR